MMPGDHFLKSPRSSHDISSQRHCEAPDPCSGLNTHSLLIRTELLDFQEQDFTWKRESGDHCRCIRWAKWQYKKDWVWTQWTCTLRGDFQRLALATMTWISKGIIMGFVISIGASTSKERNSYCLLLMTACMMWNSTKLVLFFVSYIPAQYMYMIWLWLSLSCKSKAHTLK